MISLEQIMADLKEDINQENIETKQNDNNLEIDFTDAVNINLDDIDITTENLNLDDVDDDLKQFHSDQMIKEALEQNVDLGKYAKKIEEELKQKEIASIKDYIQNSNQLVDLHDEIQNCDKLLETMQNMYINISIIHDISYIIIH